MGVYHSPDGKKSIIGKDYEGNEKQQLYLLSQNNLNSETLVEKPEYFHHFGGWSEDSKFISYSSNRRHPGYFDLIIMDIETKEEKKIFEYDGNCQPLTWLPDNKHVIIQIPETNIDTALYIVNIETKERVRIGDGQTLARYQSVQITKDGKSAYLLTDSGDETLYIARISIDQPEKLEKLVHIPKWDIEDICLSPNNDYMAYTLNEGGVSRLFIYNIETEDSKTIDIFGDGVISSMDWLNNEELIFIFNSSVLPGEVFKLNMATVDVERQTHISHSEKIENLLTEPELHTFKSFDGLEVPYFYYSKGGTDKEAAVIWVHGGPESQIRVEYNPVIQYLVSRGFTVAAPNIRGSRGYGRTYIKLDDADKRMDAVKDLAKLQEDLVKTHRINKDKIGIMGRSYGGYMTLMSITHFPDLWAAAIEIVGMSHIGTFLKNTGPWRRRRREFEYGFLEEYHEFFEKTAPLNHSHKIKAPLLIFHGKNDSRVPVEEAEQLAKEMESRGQEVEMIIFPDEGHQTVRLKNHITMNEKSIKFMQKHLQN